jgi:methylglutaconyl-CoA hydratase
VRAVVLTGSGNSFSAGADLNWMRRTSTYREAENLADARALARLMATLNELPKPTVARVNGAALGGGTGLVACCDIAVASAQAVFGTTEVRLGLIPSVIGPYVIAAIGARQARRLMLTGERIDALEAARIGLVHQVVAADALDGAVATVLDHLRRGGPAALGAAAVVAVAAAAADARGLRIAPQIRRQVPEAWRRERPVAVAAAGYGVLLGLGFTTFVLTFAVWALAGASVALGDPALGLGIGLAFGLGRALPVVALAPRAHAATAVMCERPGILVGLRRVDAVALAAVALALGTAAA